MRTKERRGEEHQRGLLRRILKSRTDKKRPLNNPGPRPIRLNLGRCHLGGTNLGLCALSPYAFGRRNLGRRPSLSPRAFGRHNLGLPTLGSHDLVAGASSLPSPPGLGRNSLGRETLSLQIHCGRPGLKIGLQGARSPWPLPCSKRREMRTPENEKTKKALTTKSKREAYLPFASAG